MKDFPPVIVRNLGKYLGGCSQRLFASHLLGPGKTRLCAGLFFMTWVSTLSLPFELWPYLLSLPIVLLKGINRLAFAWCLIILWVWLGIPSVPGRGFALLKAILPVIVGSASGRFLQKKQNPCLGIILIAIVPFCALAIVQWICRIPAPSVWLSGSERWILTTRVTAVYQNPNLFAEVLLFLLPIGLTWSLVAERGCIRGFGWGWVAMVFCSLICTFSLGAWIAAIFSISVLAAVCYSKRPGLTVLTVSLFAVAILAMIGVFHGSTASYRWALWREAWQTFLKYPWGVGPGRLHDFLAVSQTPSNHAHSLFLQTLAETGLFGLIVIFFALRTIILQITNTGDFRYVGIAVALSGLIIYGIIDYVWATPLMTGLFWLGEGMLEESA